MCVCVCVLCGTNDTYDINPKKITTKPNEPYPLLPGDDHRRRVDAPRPRPAASRRLDEVDASFVIREAGGLIHDPHHGVEVQVDTHLKTRTLKGDVLFNWLTTECLSTQGQPDDVNLHRPTSCCCSMDCATTPRPFAPVADTSCALFDLITSIQGCRLTSSETRTL